MLCRYTFIEIINVRLLYRKYCLSTALVFTFLREIQNISSQFSFSGNSVFLQETPRSVWWSDDPEEAIASKNVSFRPKTPRIFFFDLPEIQRIAFHLLEIAASENFLSYFVQLKDRTQMVLLLMSALLCFHTKRSL